MSVKIETRFLEVIKPLFGEYAAQALAQQKELLGLGKKIKEEDYRRLAEGLRAMCRDIAGPAIADQMYTGLLSAVQEAS